MGVANTGRTSYQWGVEDRVNPGDPIAATETILLETMDWSPIDTVDRTRLMRQHMMRETGDEIISMRGLNFTGSGPLLLDQFHTWLEMSVKGAVAATGSGPYRTWTFNRLIYDVPALDSFVLERRVHDGTNAIAKETRYAMLRSWTLDWNLEGPIGLTIDGFSRRLETSIFTGIGGADLVPVVEKSLGGRSTVYIDDAFAGFGTTNISSKIVGGSLTFFTGASPQRTMDNRTDLSFQLPIYNPEEISAELTLRLLLDPRDAANGDYGTELAKAEAAALRAVQINVVGTNRSLTIKLLAKHTDGSLRSFGSENGQHIMEIDMVAATDGATANAWFQAIVVNARAAVARGVAAS